MSLPQASRIAFSKTLVTASQQIAVLNTVIAQIRASQVQAQITDDANKALWDAQNNLIQAYQSERQYLNGKVYTTYSNADILAAATLSSGNKFYALTGPYLQTTQPYALGYALGANNSGAGSLNTVGSFGSTTSEQGYINAFKAARDILLNITPNNPANRITGKTCSAATTGLNGSLLTATTGFATAMANAISAINDSISSWNKCLSDEISALDQVIALEVNVSPSNRKAAAQTAKTQALAAQAAIAVWVGKNDTVAYVGADISNTAFNALSESAVAPTANTAKLYSTNLNAINAAITTREGQITTRNTQVNGYMGGWTGQSTDGTLTGVTSGYYLTSYNYLMLRLSLSGGSAVSLGGFNQAIASQNSQIAFLNGQVSTYSTLLTCSAFAADATNTNQVNLLNTAGLVAGDQIYFVSDTCDELRATIQAVNGKRVTLTQTVANRYLASENARLYKDLT